MSFKSTKQFVNFLFEASKTNKSSIDEWGPEDDVWYPNPSKEEIEAARKREEEEREERNRFDRENPEIAQWGFDPYRKPVRESKKSNKFKSVNSFVNYLFEAEEEASSPTETTPRKRKLFVLVGPPSVGKSTWISSTFGAEQPYVINRDDIVDNVASEYGWTYDDMFVTPPPDSEIGAVDEKYGTVDAAPSWMTWAKTVFSKVMEANNKVQQMFQQKVSGIPSSDQDVVVDMTNMNAGARSGALKMIGDADFEKIAVVFEFEGAEDFIKKVSEKRAEAAKRMGKSKTIPPAAFDRMFKAFSRPTSEEGFDQIVSVDNREMLKKLASNEPLQEGFLFKRNRRHREF